MRAGGGVLWHLVGPTYTSAAPRNEANGAELAGIDARWDAVEWACCAGLGGITHRVGSRVRSLSGGCMRSPAVWSRMRSGALRRLHSHVHR